MTEKVIMCDGVWHPLKEFEYEVKDEIKRFGFRISLGDAEKEEDDRTQAASVRCLAVFNQSPEEGDYPIEEMMIEGKMKVGYGSPLKMKTLQAADGSVFSKYRRLTDQTSVIDKWVPVKEEVSEINLWQRGMKGKGLVTVMACFCAMAGDNTSVTCECFAE